MFRLLGAAVAAIFLTCAGAAQAGVIEFDEGTGTYINFQYGAPDYTLVPYAWRDFDEDQVALYSWPSAANPVPFPIVNGRLWIDAGKSLLISTNHGLLITGFDIDGTGSVILSMLGTDQVVELDQVAGFQTISGLTAPIPEQDHGYPIAYIRASADQGFWIDNIVFESTAVPEPGTWALMILGFGAIGSALRAGRRGSVRHRGDFSPAKSEA